MICQARTRGHPSTFYPPPGGGLHTFSGSGRLLGEGKGGGIPDIALTRQMTPEGSADDGKRLARYERAGRLIMEKGDDIEKTRGRVWEGEGLGSEVWHRVGGFINFDFRRGFSIKNGPSGVSS